MLEIIPFAALLLAHHFLLAPLLRRRPPLYLGLLAALLAAFGAWCILHGGGPGGGPPAPQPDGPAIMGAPPPPPPGQAGDSVPPPAGGPGPLRPEYMKMIVGVLLVGADLGAYFFVESRRKERRMRELQAENVSQRLESLRYQINPHFFMNTLNNIHALVDIDPEKAKESIEQFSKMMRILLYEGDAPTIPLHKELDFIEHFVSLMRLRYPGDAVSITTDFPEGPTTAVVPPLVMASFVENAFKHGVSYNSDSYIRVGVELGGGMVVFRCSNSSHPGGGDSRHGIGLENVRKRLGLLYGRSYALEAGESEGRYDVTLSIPEKPEMQPPS